LLVFPDRHIPDNQILDNISSGVLTTTSKYSNEKPISSQESLPMSVDGQAITISISSNRANSGNIPTENNTNNNNDIDIKESQSAVIRLNSALSKF
jgi:hypothetical protein